MLRRLFLDIPDLIVLAYWRVYLILIALGGIACWLTLIALLLAESAGVRWGW